MRSRRVAHSRCGQRVPWESPTWAAAALLGGGGFRQLCPAVRWFSNLSFTGEDTQAVTVLLPRSLFLNCVSFSVYF